MSESQNIAIVGGGIAGMFCAFVLASRGQHVWLFEGSDRWGGRIRTVRLGKDGTPLPDQSAWTKDNLEFFAEFGPMRLELDKQLLLKALLTWLGIKEKAAEAGDQSAQTGSTPYLIKFPSYSSPESSRDPHYDLRPEEVGRSPLELLRLAFLRIISRLNGLETAGGATKAKQHQLIARIAVCGATQGAVDREFSDWLTTLEPEDYWTIQTHAEIDAVPLHAMGFWNLLSDYLSHDAINKIRDLGTFYHLLPENPNAAEWLVWWLVGLGSREKLRGVFGGMQCIVDALEQRLTNIPETPPYRELDAKVSGLTKKNGLFTLEFEKRKSTESLPLFDRVILALPKAALKTIYQHTPGAFDGEQAMEALLDSAFGFPMVKLFFVVSERWWQGDTRANRYATRAPTRELHYWKGATTGSRQGLIMGYSDRPASSFWANYLPAGDQIDVNMESRPTNDGWKGVSAGGVELPRPIRQRLLSKIVQITSANDVPGFTAEDIAWYGIRDWGRGPYHGANHAWRPERKYWVIMRRLGEIRSSDGGGTIHVCGEDYSDYHGFIEGALRSAVFVLHRILDLAPGTAAGSYLSWLSGSKSPGIDVDQSYVNGLKLWAQKLDCYPATEPFV
jgi:hypothetical protein